MSSLEEKDEVIRTLQAQIDKNEHTAQLASALKLLTTTLNRSSEGTDTTTINKLGDAIIEGRTVYQNGLENMFGKYKLGDLSYAVWKQIFIDKTLPRSLGPEYAAASQTKGANFLQAVFYLIKPDADPMKKYEPKEYDVPRALISDVFADKNIFARFTTFLSRLVNNADYSMENWKKDAGEGNQKLETLFMNNDETTEDVFDDNGATGNHDTFKKALATAYCIFFSFECIATNIKDHPGKKIAQLSSEFLLAFIHHNTHILFKCWTTADLKSDPSYPHNDAVYNPSTGDAARPAKKSLAKLLEKNPASDSAAYIEFATTHFIQSFSRAELEELLRRNNYFRRTREETTSGSSEIPPQDGLQLLIASPPPAPRAPAIQGPSSRSFAIVPVAIFSKIRPIDERIKNHQGCPYCTWFYNSSKKPVQHRNSRENAGCLTFAPIGLQLPKDPECTDKVGRLVMVIRKVPGNIDQHLVDRVRIYDNLAHPAHTPNHASDLHAGMIIGVPVPPEFLP